MRLDGVLMTDINDRIAESVDQDQTARIKITPLVKILPMVSTR